MADFGLAGRIAVVTGASRGIGQAVAVELARAGADVVITSRALASLEETSSAIEAIGRRALRLQLDIARVDDIGRAAREVEQQIGSPDILVNNAGVQRARPALELTEEDWDAVFATNLRGLFFCCQTFGRGMVARAGGKIINISSAAALIAWPERAAYGTSKAGVLALTRILALEWAGSGVTVNAVAPTFVETDLGRQTLNREGARAEILQRIPLHRFASKQDVSAAVRYLASPEADFVTGTTLVVDGGVTLT